MANENGSSSSRSVASQKRQKPRYTSNLKVVAFGRGLETIEPERTANISSGGLFICTEYESEVGEKIHIRIILSDIDSYFEVKTRVAWIADGTTGHPRGLGLEFIELSQEHESIIAKILSRYINVKE